MLAYVLPSTKQDRSALDRLDVSDLNGLDSATLDFNLMLRVKKLSPKAKVKLLAMLEAEIGVNHHKV